MPLLVAPENLPLHVIDIVSDDKTRKHLEALGIVKGSLITLLDRSENAVIVKIKESRLALDKETSLSIRVG